MSTVPASDKQKLPRTRSSDAEKSKTAYDALNSFGDTLYQEDTSAQSTLQLKQLSELLDSVMEYIKNKPIYIILTRTSQPISIAIAFLTLTLVILRLNGSPSESSIANTEQPEIQQQHQRHPTAVLAYLGLFAAHFGAQIWMIFINGLTLYFNLSRHTFGQAQVVLFPRYYVFTFVVSIVMVIIFARYFTRHWGLAESVQLLTLNMVACLALIVRIFWAIPMLRLTAIKYELEEAANVGQEVGGLVQRDLVNNQHYQNVNKAFRMLHIRTVISEISIFICACVHLFYLASKINFQ